MAVPSERQACRACAKAKRKCGKQLPTCCRCLRRSLNCAYPPTKPSCFVLLQDGDEQTPSDQILSYRSAPDAPAHYGDFASSLADDTGYSGWLYRSRVPSPYNNTSLPTVWFAVPSTWLIIPWPQASFVSFSRSRAKWSIARIQRWFTQLVTTGSNPFIHAELYRRSCPRELRDASTILSAYLRRTPENEDLVFQVIEARMTQVAKAGMSHEDSASQWPVQAESPLMLYHLINQLARIHTLTMYLLIALFNGDIRLRQIAEQNIPTLHL